MARLMRIPGIGSIDVDHTGTLMRLRISERDPDLVVEAVVGLLRMEGHAATPLMGEGHRSAMDRIDAWHGTAADLSREEARLLADEAAASFAREHELGATASDRLRRTIGTHLYESFTAPDASSRIGMLTSQAIPGIVSEARSYLGAEAAAALETLLGQRWPARSIPPGGALTDTGR